MESYIKEISLENYRNFKFKTLNFDAKQILIIGENGAGKTSILEAISLLTASKGLRGEKLSNLINTESDYYKLSYDIESYLGNILINQELDKNIGKRIIQMNDKKISTTELTKFVNIFWLIPQQNTLFQHSAQDRRKLFDRIVFSFYPDHAASVNKYEHYQRERIQILTTDYYDSKWAEIVEEKLTVLAIDITQKRFEIRDNLNKVISNFVTEFPKITIELNGELETIFAISSNKENDIKKIFLSSRERDIQSHKTHFGALKTDMNIIHKTKNQNAFLCSTGEQQACLVSLILGHTELFKTTFNKKPIILLDELFAHLDYRRRNELSEYLANESIQTFVTSTENEFCELYAKNAEIIHIK